MSIRTIQVSPINKLDREKRDFILARIDELSHAPRFQHLYRRDTMSKAPARVRRAHKIVREYERGIERENDKRTSAKKKIIAKIEREVLFGSVEKALKMLDAELRK